MFGSLGWASPCGPSLPVYTSEFLDRQNTHSQGLSFIGLWIYGYVSSYLPDPKYTSPLGSLVARAYCRDDDVSVVPGQSVSCARHVKVSHSTNFSPFLIPQSYPSSSLIVSFCSPKAPHENYKRELIRRYIYFLNVWTDQQVDTKHVWRRTYNMKLCN